MIIQLIKGIQLDRGSIRLKVMGGGVVAHEILVSAQGPFLDFRAKGLGPGLDNSLLNYSQV